MESVLIIGNTAFIDIKVVDNQCQLHACNLHTIDSIPI